MIQESLCCLFRDAMVKFFYQLQNRRQKRRQKSLELNHYPNRDNDHHLQDSQDASKRVNPGLLKVEKEQNRLNIFKNKAY